MSEAPEPKTLTERDLDPFADPPPPTEPPAGTVGFTHFDTPGSEDDHITVLLPREQLEALVPGAMVRIVSAGDPLTGGADRVFLGAVTGGPYAEPDGLRADAAIAVATTVGGKARWLMPNYHGRAAVQVTAELIDGRPNPPTHRPHPNSAVIPLTDAETADALHVDGPARIGTLLGKPAIHVGIDPADKNQLPRHLGILGTTGGGKSNTVANLVAGLQAQGVSVILLDVEGEYVHLDRPTQQPVMRDLLAARGMEPSGVDGLTVLHPVGRETSREGGGGAHPFCLRFGDLSPYAVMELLELSEAQQHRFMKAFDVLKVVMRDLGMLTRDQIIEIDELDRGIPGMTLAMLRDVVQVCLDKSERDAAAGRGKKGDDDAPPSRLVSSQLRDKEKDIRQRLNQTTVPGNFTSWAALIARINVLVRLNLFDNAKSDP
ncbi:MAG: helicase HerA-like domain-containing protein, partial [Planctomycetota bacterium]